MPASDRLIYWSPFHSRSNNFVRKVIVGTARVKTATSFDGDGDEMVIMVMIMAVLLLECSYMNENHPSIKHSVLIYEESLFSEYSVLITFISILQTHLEFFSPRMVVILYD